MRRLLLALCLFACAINFPLQSQEQQTKALGHYLFAWTGDAAHKGNDFLAVIDADPASISYGQLMTTIATDQRTVRIHHTEYVMPASGMLFANDHDAGRTFIFDVRDPLHPKIVTSFTDMAGYMHPHSYLRLPNGHVLATFQHVHHGESEGQMGGSGGLVEIDDSGKVIRSSSSADPALPDALLTPYSLVVLPEIDRVVSTNSSMDFDKMFSGVTYQVWRMSDLKLLKTAYLDVGQNRYAHVSPEEPRRGPDGAVYVQSLGCGIERITDVDVVEAAVGQGTAEALVEEQKQERHLKAFGGQPVGIAGAIALEQVVPLRFAQVIAELALSVSRSGAATGSRSAGLAGLLPPVATSLSKVENTIGLTST